MSSGVILLQKPYISFSSPLLLILRREIAAVAVALFYMRCVDGVFQWPCFRTLYMINPILNCVTNLSRICNFELHHKHIEN